MKGIFLRRGLLVALVLGPLLVACRATPTPTRAQSIRPAVTSLPAPATSALSTSTAVETPVSPTSTNPPIQETPTPTPAPTLRRLTGGGCCTRPFWSADSRQVRFIDRPASRPVGIYGVDVERPAPPSLVSEWIVTVSGGGEFYVYPDGNTTVVQRAETGETHVINNGGRPVSVSPDGRRLLWQVMERQGDFDERRGQVWVANLDGSDARVVAETVGVGDSRWIDGQRILVVGLPLDDLPFVGVATLTLGSEGGPDHRVQLAQVKRPRGTLLSPAGRWLVYFLTFQDDAGDDGLWIVPTDGHQPPRKLGFFGGYRWRDDAHLLYVPLEPGSERHVLWEYDVVSGETRQLTDPARTPFKIANNDWGVSPDGRYVVFVNAVDHNLWLLDLGP